MKTIPSARHVFTCVYSIVLISYVLGIQGCASHFQFAPWLEVGDNSVNVNGTDDIPSPVDFRGGEEAPTKHQVGVPRYPGSLLFRVEPFVSPTIGPFKEVCPNRRGLILVTKHEIGKVEAWYKDNLSNPLILNATQSFIPVVWGRYAHHNWSAEEASAIVMRAPYIGLSEIKGTALERVIPSYSTAIEVMYCSD